jgi:hypothetical protein
MVLPIFKDIMINGYFFKVPLKYLYLEFSLTP